MVPALPSLHIEGHLKFSFSSYKHNEYFSYNNVIHARFLQFSLSKLKLVKLESILK